jgi:dUTP pyrophosphatase
MTELDKHEYKMIEQEYIKKEQEFKQKVSWIYHAKNKLLSIYDKLMYLKLYVDGDNELKQKYIDATLIHNNKAFETPEFIDAGFDLFIPEDTSFYGIDWSDRGPVNKVDYKIKCSAKIITVNKSYNTGYYLYPRSSLSKTPLRLANSVGICDAGYRGRIMAMFDVVNLSNDESDDRECDYAGNKYDRYVQICASGLIPILVEVVETESELGSITERGSGGFGSTGK